jgi:hypothetical protein
VKAVACAAFGVLVQAVTTYTTAGRFAPTHPAEAADAAVLWAGQHGAMSRELGEHLPEGSAERSYWLVVEAVTRAFLSDPA